MTTWGSLCTINYGNMDVWLALCSCVMHWLLPVTGLRTKETVMSAELMSPILLPFILLSITWAIRTCYLKVPYITKQLTKSLE